MKKPFIFSLLLLSSLLSAQPIHNVWDPPFKQGLAAEVEDQAITFDEIRREMAPLIPRIRQSVGTREQFSQQMGELYLEVLGELVDRVLILKEFSEKEYQLPQTVVENEFDRMLSVDFNNDRAKFHEYLESQGMTVLEFRQDLRERIIVSIMQGERRRNRAQISPERIEKFYNENKLHFYEEEAVKLRIIMLRPLADETADLMQQQVDRVMQELADGRSFADVARQYSQDSRRERGGDWGWLERADLKDELSVAAFQLQAGQYSDPLQIENQFYILYAEDFRPEGIQPLNAARDTIEEIISNQLARQSQQQWLERLRRDAYIKYF